MWRIGFLKCNSSENLKKSENLQQSASPLLVDSKVKLLILIHGSKVTEYIIKIREKGISEIIVNGAMKYEVRFIFNFFRFTERAEFFIVAVYQPQL